MPRCGISKRPAGGVQKRGHGPDSRFAEVVDCRARVRVGAIDPFDFDSGGQGSQSPAFT